MSSNTLVPFGQTQSTKAECQTHKGHDAKGDVQRKGMCQMTYDWGTEQKTKITHRSNSGHCGGRIDLLRVPRQTIAYGHSG